MDNEKTLYQQYETIRRSGGCNMFDCRCVRQLARELGFNELATITPVDYSDLIVRYDELKEKYG